jgi:hypothetical protein
LIRTATAFPTTYSLAFGIGFDELLLFSDTTVLLLAQ